MYTFSSLGVNSYFLPFIEKSTFLPNKENNFSPLQVCWKWWNLWIYCILIGSIISRTSFISCNLVKIKLKYYFTVSSLNENIDFRICDKNKKKLFRKNWAELKWKKCQKTFFIRFFSCLSFRWNRINGTTAIFDCSFYIYWFLIKQDFPIFSASSEINLYYTFICDNLP